MKKKKYIACVGAILLCAMSLFTLSSCNNKPPDIEDVMDRFVYLIEQSKEINSIFFGCGMPVYKNGSDISDKKNVYGNVLQSSSPYEYFMENARYLTIDSIKLAAEQVYSEKYISSLYEAAFDGVLISDSTYVRYYEDSNWIYQNKNAEALVKNERIYLYSTMEIVKPFKSDYVNIEIDSYTVNDPENIQRIRLSFVYENNNWYLDSPTY